MTQISPDQLRAMVAPGRVHRRLYTDPNVFNLKIEKIFGAAWIYVGHESQVKEPANSSPPGSDTNRCSWFVTQVADSIAPQSVRPPRGDGRGLGRGANLGISLLLPRLDLPPGWSSQGGAAAARISRSFRSQEPGRPDAQRAARSELSRLCFGSLAADGPSLTDYLGYMTTSFDDMVTAPPTE